MRETVTPTGRTMRFNERTGDWAGDHVPRRQQRPRRPVVQQNASADAPEINWDRVWKMVEQLDERAHRRSEEHTAAINRYFDAVERDYRESEEHPFRYFLKKLFKK